ncbi:polyribonucleotide nucleotidyltransferase [Haliovirga abyssi]|uniref:Polyribonucleotide nucleotidyltransferase n=1 Tax=Haliovirga abyssi TaxID=2996794 RepID=A0AAU9DF42_9FUSO|nr:polyribonucleotide nucleotidyltransferase [Haliovirga abyssi]BDU49987.1 polyribonucleotide nucleotidyltransferase [Haliovirga abyssi]
MFNEKMVEMELAGRKLTFTTGKMARQAGGAVILSYGETVLLATVVGKKKPREGADFFPLTVNFIEKTYSAGKIPGGFFKREARPSTNATLTARLIDRPIRPLFPEGFKNEVQIDITVLSYDGENTTDYLGIIGASAALSISDVPFLGPVAGVIVGYVDGEYVLNPLPEQLEKSEINLSVAGTKDAITMVESGAKEVSEELMLGAIMFGHDAIKTIVAIQEEFQKLAGKEKMEFEVKEVPVEIKEFVDINGKEKLEKAVLVHGKLEREEAVDSLELELEELLATKYEDGEIPKEDLSEFKGYFHDLMKKMVRDTIVYKHHRVDGRAIDEIRPISIDIDILPIPHGTALFTRGETQGLVITTLGTAEDEQIIDGLDKAIRKHFYLHYNFPPYSVGETGFLRGPGRRELGHGALAERALREVMPSQEEFPYTVRVVSEILESNGSSSMATVCGGSLSLMAAGVPIKKHVAGVAMGLIKQGEDFVVLTDIMGLEDHIGDMDFKVTGTRKGITALQMDIKITGISREIMEKALEQALKGRLFILNKMEAVIDKPRVEFAPTVPRLATLTIDKEKISDLIGPGGKNIKGIIEKTEAKIDIKDDGNVSIFAINEEKLNETLTMIKAYTQDIEVGEIYTGKVIKIMKFGAFVEVLPGKEGLLHVSELDHKRVANVEDVLKEGEEVMVKVIGKEKGKFSLSRKALIPKEEK